MRIFFIRYFPILETATWIIFIYLGLRGIFEEHYFWEIILFIAILVVLFFISWFFLRDFLAGIFIKSENQLDINKSINLPVIKGKINKIGYRSIEIKTENGELTKIPYSKLANDIITFPNEGKEYCVKHIIELTLKNDRPYTDYLQMLRMYVLNIPWTHISKDPVISLEGTSIDEYTFKVEFYALNKDQAQRAEIILRNHLKKI
ncbi:MAG: mechanosensitive ion channel [Bacteroidales bacterium]|nr:mechanosensitive ion channel [Bacteroidales bacterium]